MQTPRITNWDLLKAIHNARIVKGADRHLLNALAIRAHAQKDFTCYPSYQTLSLDTGLSINHLRTSARNLEQSGYIRRALRGNRSNVFQIDAARIKALGDEALAARTEAGRQWLNEMEPDEWGTEGAPENVEEYSERHGVDLLQRTVETCWPDHPALQSPNTRAQVTSALKKCVKLAGSPQRCADIITMVCEGEPRVRQRVAEADNLGGYLVTCMPGWIATYPDSKPEGTASQAAEEPDYTTVFETLGPPVETLPFYVPAAIPFEDSDL